MTGSIAADLSTGQGEAGAVFERWIKTGQWRRTGASVPTIVGGVCSSLFSQVLCG